MQTKKPHRSIQSPVIVRAATTKPLKPPSRIPLPTTSAFSHKSSGGDAGETILDWLDGTDERARFPCVLAREERAVIALIAAPMLRQEATKLSALA
jgi:hypothetical protein